MRVFRAPERGPACHAEGGDADGVATQIHRLAVLLHAGLTPERAWVHVDRAGESEAEPQGAPTGEEHANPVVVSSSGIADILARRGGVWAEVGAAWRVATTVGAPLAESLRAAADALRDAEQTRQDVAVALAEPAMTARVIAWLPLVGILLVVALGFDVGAIVGEPLGVACLVGGATLILVARFWTRRLVRRAQPAPGTAGWACDLMAVALTGGVSIERATVLVEEAGCVEVRQATGETLALSRATGAPAVELLRAQATEERRVARTQGRLRAAALGGRLLVPLGVCTLPAFLLLGVAPMVLSVLAGADLEF